ncbi:MAG TPA: terminase family protein, partial [Phycisphaerae bacterium]|nr:terminase family protein [Phycisphaerae bacterium]
MPGPQHYLAHGLYHHNSPNLPHYKRSLWPEFRRWCPWGRVVDKHQRFGKLDWEPHEPFNIVFKNDATLHCTGIENPGSLEGPNINFAHFDEARHHPDDKALKVLDGRVRIPGPKGEPPQIYLTTTPARHWLYTYFGPVIAKCPTCGDILIDRSGGKPWACPQCGRQDGLEPDDPFAAFKADARDIVLLTVDNEANLFEGFAQARAQTLTEKEARVLLEAAWEDLSEGQPFLPDMTWWDHCREDVPPLGTRESLVLALDAATGRMATSS